MQFETEHEHASEKAKEGLTKQAQDIDMGTNGAFAVCRSLRRLRSLSRIPEWFAYVARAVSAVPIAQECADRLLGYHFMRR